MEYDPASYTFSYIIIEGNLPVSNYKSTVTITPNESSNSATITWSGEFDVNVGLDPTSFAASIREGVYKAGIDSLIAKMSIPDL